MTEEIQIIDKESILVRPRNPIVAKILDALPELQPNQAIMVDLADRRAALKVRTALSYHKDKRHRPGEPSYPNLEFTMRGTCIICWLGSEKAKEE